MASDSSSEIGPRCEAAVRFFVALCVLCISMAVVVAREADCRSTATGDLEMISFQSRVFHNTRMLRVLLPPDYRRMKTRIYPVLYLNDGQNLFDVCTSIFSHE